MAITLQGRRSDISRKEAAEILARQIEESKQPGFRNQLYGNSMERARSLFDPALLEQWQPTDAQLMAAAARVGATPNGLNDPRNALYGAIRGTQTKEQRALVDAAIARENRLAEAGIQQRQTAFEAERDRREREGLARGDFIGSIASGLGGADKLSASSRAIYDADPRVRENLFRDTQNLIRPGGAGAFGEVIPDMFGGVPWNPKPAPAPLPFANSGSAITPNNANNSGYFAQTGFGGTNKPELPYWMRKSAGLGT